MTSKEQMDRGVDAVAATTKGLARSVGPNSSTTGCRASKAIGDRYPSPRVSPPVFPQRRGFTLKSISVVPSLLTPPELSRPCLVGHLGRSFPIRLGPRGIWSVNNGSICGRQNDGVKSPDGPFPIPKIRRGNGCRHKGIPSPRGAVPLPQVSGRTAQVNGQNESLLGTLSLNDRTVDRLQRRQSSLSRAEGNLARIAHPNHSGSQGIW
jgi:hypothetical protein